MARIGFFEDAENSFSWTRLALSVLLLWWCINASYLVFADKINMVNSAFMGGCLTAILGGKVLSKKQEVKTEVAELEAMTKTDV